MSWPWIAVESVCSWPEHGPKCQGFEAVTEYQSFNKNDFGDVIPKEFQLRVSKPFILADASDARQQGGTGLGLSISKVIAEKIHGEIGFLTKAGSGTTFYLRFDRLKEPYN
ncbi:MAG: ATP-binding protein [Magnetovibrio sp.]|nr:ATP-binding protein [Magnetovibrio sp.]